MKKIILEKNGNNIMKKSIKEFSNDEIRKISKILSDKIIDDDEIEFIRDQENYYGIDDELIEIWNNILNEEENKIIQED